ncbi:MAG TPA: integrase core domain-containing protein [Streptosporangiaceae bacterium]|nr:integrase core domain-containing protein [Streptosporangiaceae bacterium]
MNLIFLIVTRVGAGLVPAGGVWKDAEILMLRHQLAVTLRERPRVHSRLTWPGRAWLALLAGMLPAGRLAAMRLIVTPATILRWHRDIVRRRCRAAAARVVRRCAVMYVLAVIEHGSRRVRVLGATEHPVQSWVVQQARNLLMDLEDAGARAKFVLHDRDASFTQAFDTVFQAAGIRVIRSAVQAPRMNPVMERWIGGCRRELLDRTLIWNQRHLMMVLREYEDFCNSHRPHRARWRTPRGSPGTSASSSPLGTLWRSCRR